VPLTVRWQGDPDVLQAAGTGDAPQPWEAPPLPPVLALSLPPLGLVVPPTAPPDPGEEPPVSVGLSRFLVPAHAVAKMAAATTIQECVAPCVVMVILRCIAAPRVRQNCLKKAAIALFAKLGIWWVPSNSHQVAG
jgi:hypothetical protein